MSLLLPASFSHGTTNLSPLPPLASPPYVSLRLVPHRLLNNNLSRTHVTTTTIITSAICFCRHNEKVHNSFPSSMSGHRVSWVSGTPVGRVCSSLGLSTYNGCSGSEDAIAQEPGTRSDGEEEGEDSDDEEELEEGLEIRDSIGPERWDVLGLGQAMVDFSGVVDDEFLKRLGLEKGTRKLVNHEERGRVLRAMDGCSYKAAAGGSLSNTLVALARLGGRSIGGPALNIAMTGSVGSDPLAGFYRAKLRRANVNFLSEPVKDGTTGTVIVLTTPDAQRTMLAYQGTSSTVSYDPYLASVISKTNILIVEGYLFELPHTIKTIAKACEDAHRSGALVAVTASDVSCIERHYDNFWDIIGKYADIVFANSDEARAFCHFSSKESPVSATRYLSHFVPLVSVTDGPKGSYIGVKGEAIYIPPSPCVPVDTCGAGDSYASGILYGILRGVSDLKGMGTLASRVAAVVVGQQGTRLCVQDAVKLAESFAFQINSSGVHFDVGSDHISSF
ncbi:uncharacterized sugar kinase slr0537 [Macadamia integrifolia]|uniref:uncharacterized sugar kinase slr0537 n=1 Tax=Macadamia integrifolia TaxID=60698 RepID=UPI001C4ED045|nr:uncharacterized sugar kinase slr0537 [Macadamia integrifolia]